MTGVSDSREERSRPAGIRTAHNESATQFNLKDTAEFAVARADGKNSKLWTNGLISRAEIVETISHPADHKECGSWLFATLNGSPGAKRVCRKRETVNSRSAAALDADHPLPDLLDKIRGLGISLVWHPTWRSTPDLPRYRIIVLLSRPVSPDEYRRIVNWLMDQLGRAGRVEPDKDGVPQPHDQFDRSCAQPEQFSFLPSTQDPATYEWGSAEGPALDVDEWLRTHPEAPEDAAEEAPGVAADMSRPPTKREIEMAEGALAKAELLVSGPVEGSRNDTLFRQAVWLANYAAGGCLDWDEVASALTAAVAGTGLPAEEISKTLDNAWTKGSKGPRRPREDSGFNGLPEEDQRELLDAIFEATPTLQQVRRAAHSRSTSATSVLGALLATIVSRIPVNHVLPPIIGSYASLNFAVALVSASGGGKSTSMGVVDDLLHDRREPGVYQAGAGSGEGLVTAFMESAGKGKNAKLVLTAYPHVLLTVDEIGRLGDVQGRNGSSMASVLRTGLTGGSLTTSNATRERNRVVPRMSYRLAIVAGVQPALSGILLNDQDAGTPQRWVWLPTDDPSLPDVADQPTWPGPLDWPGVLSPEPDVMLDRHVLSVPPEVALELKERQTRIVQGRAEPGLDSHAGLTQLKIAASLAYLHNEQDITRQWWTLAGSVLRLSNSVRTGCVAALRDLSDQEMKQAGRRDAIRGQASVEMHWEAVRKMAASVRKRCDDHFRTQKHNNPPGCTRRCFSNILQRHSSEEVTQAIAEAEGLGWIVKNSGARWVPGEADTENDDEEN